MMRMMGWSPGQGMGLHGQGRAEPIEATNMYKPGMGLGSASGKERVNKKSKVERYVYVSTGESDLLGIIESGRLKIHALTTKGLPRPTGEYAALLQPRVACRWGGAILLGVAEGTYPQPQDWSLADIGKPLDKIEVRDLTRAFVRLNAKVPTCMAAWEERLGAIHWREVSMRYTIGISTPRDFGSHYKNVLHRKLVTNTRNSAAPTSDCRMCGQVQESIKHIAECTCLRDVFSRMREIDKGTAWNDSTLNLLGVHENGAVIPRGVSMVHFIIWKLIIIQLTDNSFNGTPVRGDLILDMAQRRIHTRIGKAIQEVNECLRKAESRGDEKPRFDHVRSWLKGIGTVDGDGKITLIKKLRDWLYPEPQ